MKRLPDPVKRELCERFGADPSSLSFLGGGQDWSDGTLFRYGDGRPMVLKILEFPAEDARAVRRAEERVAWIRRFADGGAKVILPVPSRAGRLFEAVEEEAGVFAAYAYPLAPGRPVNRDDAVAHRGAFYRAVGAVLGRLHAVAEEHAETLSTEGSSDTAGALQGWREEWAFMRRWCKDDEVGAAWERLRDALALLPVDKRGYGFVHNDAHVWNLLLDPESAAARPGEEPGLTLIDFDCAGYQWFLCDGAIALYSFLILGSGGIETEAGPPEGLRERTFRAFWEGYRRHRDPGADWMERLDLFLQYRRCLLFMPFQERTAKDAAWRNRWKDRILAEDARLFGAP